MRALLSKVLTGSMVAGAALLVAACGGEGDEAANNVAAADLGTEMLDTTNDVTAIDAGTGADVNMAVDTGADANAAANATNTTDAGGNEMNGM
jgi:hypothetical protein